MEKKEIIKKSIFFSSLVIIFFFVFLIIINYQVEGEKEIPYKPSKILLVSTVDGIANEDKENLWNIDVIQTNDIFIYIDSDKNTNETIKEISIENFNIIKDFEKGNIEILRPTSDLDNLYKSSVQNYLNDKIVYQGAKLDDMKSLEISNNGGIIGFRVALNNLGKFISNDENLEIIYDGRLLSNLGISLEEIKLKLNFDIIIKTSENISYKGTISMEMPTDEIITEGVSKTEIIDFSNVVFKRISSK
ncbi:MAG: hypothetical protein IKM97_03475 [Clostridia bacterium]|nr:hypothetical protein [Clostridia bacterium]